MPVLKGGERGGGKKQENGGVQVGSDRNLYEGNGSECKEKYPSNSIQGCGILGRE